MYRNPLIIILVSALFIFSCKEKKTPPPAKVPVNLYSVTAQHVYYYDEYPANTEALNQVNLVPQVQGYVTGIFFTEGTRVKKGQKLYEIDRRLYQDAYDQAVANLKVSQGTLEQSQQDAERYDYLNKYHAVAKQLYDHAMITLATSKSQVQASEQSVKSAKTNLDYSIIYAPFDGTIGFSQVKLGNLVVVGQTILNTISTDDPLAVDFYINEKLLPAFEKLKSNKNTEPDSLFTIELPNNNIFPYTGKISIIDRAIDQQSGTIRVRLVFPNPHDDLKAGMSCVVRVHNQDSTPQLVIPNRAVVEQMGEYFVFTVKDTIVNNSNNDSAKNATSVKNNTSDTAATKGPQLLAFQKKIQLGRTIGPNIIVTKGLTTGDKIVVDGVQQLHDGTAVTTSGKPQRSGNTMNNNNSDNNTKGSDSSKND